MFNIDNTKASYKATTKITALITYMYFCQHIAICCYTITAGVAVKPIMSQCIQKYLKQKHKK